MRTEVDRLKKFSGTHINQSGINSVEDTHKTIRPSASSNSLISMGVPSHLLLMTLRLSRSVLTRLLQSFELLLKSHVRKFALIGGLLRLHSGRL